MFLSLLQQTNGSEHCILFHITNVGFVAEMIIMKVISSGFC